MVLKLIEEGKEDVLFLDEAVFTTGQVRATTWMAMN